uniref:Uncharacterized protein n=1 Tax=Arion vulgaris TaxID=1028688 RepID=A0A0B7A5B2_9EUPU
MKNYHVNWGGGEIEVTFSMVRGRLLEAGQKSRQPVVIKQLLKTDIKQKH